MKRVLLALFMLSATVGVTSLQPVAAYTPAPAAVTQAAFMVKVNQMDAQLTAGNVTAAQTTWDEIHTMMLSVLAVTKSSIHSAATPSAAAPFNTIMSNQITLYQAIWGMKSNLVANQSPIRVKLTEFSATIY